VPTLISTAKITVFGLENTTSAIFFLEIEKLIKNALRLKTYNFAIFRYVGPFENHICDFGFLLKYLYYFSGRYSSCSGGS